MDDKPNPQAGAENRPHLRPPGPPMSAARRALWIALLGAAVAGLVFWIGSRPKGGPPGARFAMEGPVPVVVATAAKGDIDVVLRALGTVTPIAMVTVRSQISGTIVRLDFTEGQEVARGAPLAEIDARPYEAQLAQAQGQLARDQALLGDAKANLKRYRVLARQDSIARQQLEDQEFLVRQYDGTVAADRALVETAKLNIAYCHIVSPIAGRVGLRQVDAGNYVTPGDANGIAVVTQMRPISVLFSLPQNDLPEVLRRLRTGATLEATAYDGAGTEKLANGSLSAINNQIDTATGTIELRADFANRNETLYPNQFVNIHLRVKTVTGATLVPAAAILHGQPGAYVYLVRPDQTVIARPVTLGPSEDGRVAITAGLAPGDRVVVDGADNLRNGAKIVLRSANGGAAVSGAPEQRRPARHPAP